MTKYREWPNSWEPCLADPEGGVAFFDGLRFRTDRITDPRWDRVLPILEEEQVFMCRAMRRRLKKEQRVLDVGTGSGVFAIEAARCGCHVLGIDISDRAIRFARENQAWNQQHLTCGKIEWQLQDVRELAAADRFNDHDKRYDVVILAPPYNPTVDWLRPALHASAGELGQDAFRQQFPLIQRLLKRGGMCIGNQMAVVSSAGTMSVTDAITPFLGSKLSYLRIIAEDHPVADFLERQYALYLDERLEFSDRDQLKNLRRLIESNKDIGNSFALIYYEFTLGEEGATGSSTIQQLDFDDSGRPPQSWDDRIRLHRQIIDFQALGNEIPAPTLFLMDSLIPPLRYSSERVPTWLYRYTDRWIAARCLLAGSTQGSSANAALDLLIVDSAPWYPGFTDPIELLQGAAAWSSRPHYASQALTTYLKSTQEMRRVKIGPFLHPAFTGSPNDAKSGRWRTAHCSVSGLPVENTPAEIMAFIDRLDDEHHVEDPSGVESWSNPLGAHEAAYLYSRLHALNRGSWEEYRHDVRDAVRKLSTHYTLSDSQLEVIDLNHRHLAMHAVLDRKLLKSGRSFLFGIPVSIVPSQSAIENALDHYRGGIWIYAVAREGKEQSAEQVLFDLARLLRMLYEAEYASLAARQIQEHAAEAATFDVYGAIRPDLVKLLEATDATSRQAMRIQAVIDPAKRSFLSLYQYVDGLFRSGTMYYCIRNETDGPYVADLWPTKKGEEWNPLKCVHAGANLDPNDELTKYRQVLSGTAAKYSQSEWLPQLADCFIDQSLDSNPNGPKAYVLAFNFLKIVIQRPHVAEGRVFEQQLCFAIRLAAPQQVEVLWIDVDNQTAAFNKVGHIVAMSDWLKSTAALKRSTSYYANDDFTEDTYVISDETRCAALLGAIMQLIGEELRPGAGGAVNVEKVTVKSMPRYVEVELVCRGAFRPEATRLHDRAVHRGLQSCLLTLCKAVNQLQPLHRKTENVPAFEVFEQAGKTTLILRLPRHQEKNGDFDGGGIII